jgi:ribosomal protein L7/L12
MMIQADAAPAEEESSGPSQVTVKLTGFKDDSKVKVIKEIKNIMAPLDPKFNLAAAKRLVEGVPATIKVSEVTSPLMVSFITTACLTFHSSC